MAVADLSDGEMLERPWPRPVLRLVEAAEPAEGPPPAARAVPWAAEEPLDWEDAEPFPEPDWVVEPPMPAARRRSVASGERARVRAVRRRRAALGVLAVGLLAALAAPVSALGGRTVSTPAAASVPAPPTRSHAVVYVVQPGDSLRSIAARLSPGSASRSLATALAAELGTDHVVPGERLVLP